MEAERLKAKTCTLWAFKEDYNFLSVTPENDKMTVIIIKFPGDF